MHVPQPDVLFTSPSMHMWHCYAAMECVDGCTACLQAAVGHNMPAFQAALNVPLPSFDSPLPSQPMSTTQAPVSQPSLDRQPIDSGLPAPNSDPEIKVEPVETTNQPGTDAQPVEPLQPTASERIAPAGRFNLQ